MLLTFSKLAPSSDGFDILILLTICTWFVCAHLDAFLYSIQIWQNAHNISTKKLKMLTCCLQPVNQVQVVLAGQCPLETVLM